MLNVRGVGERIIKRKIKKKKLKEKGEWRS
jgi:hypothetical protein